MKNYINIKNTLDISLAIILILLFLPVFIILSILIKTTDGGSIFFKQIRVGKNGKLFKIIKFRTMYENTENSSQLTTKNDSRITPIGIFLRKYRLDELPQLINVIKGEMSFVGPRPEVPKYVKFYNKNMLKTLSIKPGITALSSIKFKNEDELLEKYYLKCPDNDFNYINFILPIKMKYNINYLKKISFFEDIRIIILTILNIIFK